MSAYAAWLRVCDFVSGLRTEGMMTDDFPDYDWRRAWEYDDTPQQAVDGALARAGYVHAA